MRLKIIRAIAVCLVCPILIVGSFVTNNFGISQAYVGWTLVDPPSLEGFVCLNDCYSDMTYQVPYQQSWYIDPNLALPAKTIAILLITFWVLSLFYLYPRSGRQERDLHFLQNEEVSYPIWEAHFKKYNYRQSDKVLPKRHAKYYKLSTG
jgi:hypothetical protein